MSPPVVLAPTDLLPLRPSAELPPASRRSYSNEYLKAQEIKTDQEATKPTMSKDSQRKIVEKYLQEHDLEAVMNEVVNKCVKERPVDPFLFLSTHMKELSSTSSGIKSVVARQIYDPNGTPTIYASDNFSGSIRCQCSHI